MAICLFASEIGNLLGRNRFVKYEDAIDAVVVRIRPECVSTRFLRQKRKACSVQEELPCTTTIHECDQWKQEKMKTAMKIEQVCIQAVTIPETSQQQLVDQLSSLVPIHVVERCISELEHTRTLPLTSVKRHVQHMLEDVAIAIPTATTLSTRMVTEMHQIAVCNIYKANGLEAEARLVKRDAIKSNNTMRLKKIVFPGCILFGKVDGIADDGRPIEIKNRQNKLFRRLWPSELVQIYVYMFMTGQPKALFIETYADERYEEVIEFDHHVWNEMVRGIRSVVVQINEILNPTTDLGAGLEVINSVEG